MQFDWFPTRSEDRKEWEALCPPDEYRVVTAAQLPSIIPKGLAAKADSVFVAASGDPGGAVYYMTNMNRVDEKDHAIDQNPFGLGFVGSSPTASGCLIQHGDWPSRTIYPPEAFWKHVAISGIGSVYPISELPPNPSGPLSALTLTSHREAFGLLIDKLRRFTTS